jgi:hypothetical protein
MSKLLSATCFLPIPSLISSFLLQDSQTFSDVPVLSLHSKSLLPHSASIAAYTHCFNYSLCPITICLQPLRLIALSFLFRHFHLFHLAVYIPISFFALFHNGRHSILSHHAELFSGLTLKTWQRRSRIGGV